MMGRTLPLHVLLNIALFMPTHHCMMHAVHMNRRFFDLDKQRKRYIAFANRIPDIIRQASVSHLLYDEMDMGFYLKLGNIQLYDPSKPHRGQERAWCRCDFERGIYFFNSPAAFNYINPNVFNRSYDDESDTELDMEGFDLGAWLLPDNPPIDWIDFPHLLKLEWRGKSYWLPKARKLIFVLCLPGAMATNSSAIDVQSLDVEELPMDL